MTTRKVFESIMNDPEKIAAYKKNPLQHAALFALYNYSKKGLKFSDLPWFSLSKNKKAIRKAA